jgi:hypothetical protein
MGYRSMRTFNWLKRLRKDERGNALIIGAAALPLLLGSAAFAVDTIQITLMKRQLQRGADSAALAGAFAVSQGVDPYRAVHSDLDQNYFPELTQEETISYTPRLGFQKVVRVQMHSDQTLPFMSIFTSAPSRISADATAAVISAGRFCVLSLYDGTDPGIDISGNATLDLGCGMATNSHGTDSFQAGGSLTLNASPIMSVGGLDGAKNKFGTSTLQPYSAKQQDPFASVPDPPAQTCTNEVHLKKADGDATLSPGCYQSLEFDGKATLAPGTYYINGGDLSFGSQANLTGNGVTFVMTGLNGKAGDLKMNGQAELNLTSPTSGDYKGLAFYRDRRADNIQIKINGGSGMHIDGAMYFPSSDLWFNGGSDMVVSCLRMVGQKLTFRGNTNLTNQCPAGSPNAGFELSFVRLVG